MAPHSPICWWNRPLARLACLAFYSMGILWISHLFNLSHLCVEAWNFLVLMIERGQEGG